MSEHEHNNNAKPRDLRAMIVERIETENIKPHSWWYWLVLDSAVWTLWVVSVLLGALAVSVVLFASVHMSFELYEATHPSSYEFMMETLPFLWLFVLAVMFLAGYYNLRHTKHGYRYSLPLVIASSIGASIALGFLFHALNIGYYVDTFLGRHMPMYESQEHMAGRSWQRPTAGRLMGHFIETDENTEGYVWFKDMDGGEWMVTLGELAPRELKLLSSGDDVRVIGFMATDTPNMLHGCGVFPWLFDKPPVLSELREQREMFIERMQEMDRPLGERIKEEFRELGQAHDELLEHWCDHMPMPAR
ncbi:hypothetical protein KC722_01855 [Candidatus Kaiserbacteria bacterium]|nr:hypothetical protein [Candidatus Kaiserbacteria bacterium]MCB9811918.1 hypothetical protein [Candidatus Nomurabacteria bacterium]